MSAAPVANWLRHNGFQLTPWQEHLMLIYFGQRGPHTMHMNETTARAHALDATLYAIEVQADALRRLVPGAIAAQYELPPVPRPAATDAAQRGGQGGHSDPTGEAATDALRLSLSSTVGRVERLAPRVLEALAALTADLEAAKDAWESPLISRVNNARADSR